jgi:hypothetical protein
MHKFALVAERAAQICAALAALVFFVSGLVYLCWGHWPVTHLDYWTLYEFAFNHTWLESAVHKHAEHLLFFPTFLWLADLRFFHGDQELLFVAGLGLLFLTAALLTVLVWRDKMAGLAAKITATLIIIVGNFWMARASITGSGGFNCICSLVTASLALAVLILAGTGVGSARSLAAMFIVACAGFVAPFSFGTGLAIWPTLFFLAWCLRLPWRSFVPLGIATAAAIIIYQQIPPPLVRYGMIQTGGPSGLALLGRLCRVAGNPLFYAASGWNQKPLSFEAAESSMLSLWSGAAGLAIAGVAMVLTLIRRDLTKSSLKLVGMALVIFNFVVMVLIVAGNRFRGREFEFLLPRYLFWSTLFWVGLLLIVIQYAESKLWLRWPVWVVAFALPVLAFPQHYRSGLNARWARVAAEHGAVSLVNGVRDEKLARVLFGYLELGYRVAEQLRVRRLDMFADGLQDWIGLGEANLFGERRKPEKLKGRCVVTALVHCDNGAPAARVVGLASKHGGRVPKMLVIVGPTGVVCGVARSSTISPFINRAFYLGKVKTNGFLGYIRDYNPQLKYVVRSADNGILSEEEIPVRVGGTKPAKP